MNKKITIIDKLDKKNFFKNELLYLLVKNFLNSRYSNLNTHTIDTFIEAIIENDGIVVFYGEPPIASCHAKLSLMHTEDGVFKTVFIGGMCVQKINREQGIGLRLIRTIESYYSNISILNFALFAREKSMGFYHAERNNYIPKIRWYRYLDRVNYENIIPIYNWDVLVDSEIGSINLKGVEFGWKKNELRRIFEIGLFGNKLYIGIDFKGEMHLLSKGEKYFINLGEISFKSGFSNFQEKMLLRKPIKERCIICEIDSKNKPSSENQDNSNVLMVKGELENVLKAKKEVINRICTF